MMLIAIDYDTYVTAMAALLEQDALAARLGHPTLRWTQARKTLKAAMLATLSREIDHTTPALLRRQAG